MANPLRISEKMRQGVFRALPTELSVNPKIERTRTRTEDDTVGLVTAVCSAN